MNSPLPGFAVVLAITGTTINLSVEATPVIFLRMYKLRLPEASVPKLAVSRSADVPVSVLESVVAPVTANVLERLAAPVSVVAPVTPSVPVTVSFPPTLNAPTTDIVLAAVTDGYE